MATIDKLEYINNTKNLIKNALNTKFNSQIGDGDTFRSYAQKIDDIYENWPKVSEENTNFTLNSTKEGKMKIDLKGNTSQATSILPSGYTQVDYIESNGTQYIDTGIIASNLIRVQAKYKRASGIACLFGGRIDYNNSNYAYWTDGGSNKTRDIFRTPGTMWEPDLIDVSKIVYIDKNKNVTSITVDGETISHTYTDTTFNANYNIYLFGCNNAGNVMSQYIGGTIYYCKMYDNNVLVRNFIPCYRNSDNEVGLYDLVNNVFYTNAGTGAFTYGSVVVLPNLDYPQDIHTVSGNNSINVCGKNILYYVDKTTSWAGAKINTKGNTITYTPNTSGQGGMSHGTYIQDIFIPAGSTLTFSQRYVSGSAWTSGSLTNQIKLKRKDGTYLSKGFGDITTSIYQNTKKVTFTTEEDYIGILCSSMMYAIAGMTTPLVYNVQLEYNSNITDFEPYQNQNYPINLENIELYKIGDYQDSIKKSTEKNLFNKNNINGLNVYLDTTNNKLASNNNNKSIYISCKPNTTYTISKMPSKRFGVAYTYTTPTKNTAIYGTITNYDGTSITITTDTNAQYLVVWVINSNISGEISYQTAIDTLQIELGNQATTYEPYGTSWYLNKQIGKVVFDGSESWQQLSEMTWGANGYYIDKPTGAMNWGRLIAIYFKDANISSPRILSNGEMSITASSLVLRNNNTTTVTNFKTWLGTHNTTLYYVLATPTYTEITDSTLISQLEALKKAISYNEQTNTSQTNNDLPFILNVSALKKNSSN